GPARVDGAVLVVASVAAFLVLFLVMAPRFSGGGGDTVAVRRLGDLGRTNGAILKFVATRPAAFAGIAIDRVARAPTLDYLAPVLTPFAPFAAAAPFAVAIALAGALFNVV